MDMKKTGALIADIRKEMGLTQEQLGEKVYVTGKAVSKWERGVSAPGIDLLEPLARVLGITVTELLAVLTALLAVVLVLDLWGPVIFQRGNPIPYLAAAVKLTAQPYARVEDRNVHDLYITRGHDCPELFQKIETDRGVTFVEQMGSAFRFTNGKDSLTVSSEIYWRYFVVWQVPTHTLQSP